MPIVSRTLVGSQPDTSLPVICYDNLFTESGTFSTTGTDYENAFDGLTYDGWETTATGGTIEFTADAGHGADYFAFAAHDLHTYAGNIKLEYHNGSGWVELAAAAPGDASPMVLLFDRATSNRWKVTVTSSGAVTIGAIFAGERLSMPRGVYVGMAPPQLARVDRFLVEKSQAGQFLGRRVIRTGTNGTLNFEYLNPQWVRDSFKAFMDYGVERIWFFLWNPERWPLEAMCAWTTAPIRARNTHPRFMAADVSYEALL